MTLHTASFRFFTGLRLKNGNIFKNLIKHDVFQPILQLTTRESKRDNLVSSTCLEYFDYMRRVCTFVGMPLSPILTCRPCRKTSRSSYIIA